MTRGPLGEVGEEELDSKLGFPARSRRAGTGSDFDFVARVPVGLTQPSARAPVWGAPEADAGLFDQQSPAVHVKAPQLRFDLLRTIGAEPATPEWQKAYLEENFKQWRFFVRSARKDETGPKLPAESAVEREGE